jgi:hypothetical protein
VTEEKKFGEMSRTLSDYRPQVQGRHAECSPTRDNSDYGDKRDATFRRKKSPPKVTDSWLRPRPKSEFQHQ